MGRLFWKCFCAFWLALFIASAGVGTTVWLRYRTEPQSMEREGPREHHGPLISALSVALTHGGVPAARDLMMEWAMRPRPMPMMCVLDEKDQDILGRPMPPEWREDGRPPLPDGPPDQQIRAVKAPDGHEYRIIAFPPPRHFDRGRPPPPPHREPPTPLSPIVTSIIASVLLSAGLAWYLAWPIRHLRNAFQSFAQGRLEVRIAPLMRKRRDELADLGKDFDDMAAQICTLVQAQRRLLHDVSHELRSPLARLQAAIGLLRQQPELMEHYLANAERAVDRVNLLVGELLTLSRLETNLPTTQEETCDLADMLAEIVEDAKIEAQLKSVHIVFEAEATLLFQGKTELIHRAIENVVRNALHYTPPRSTITMTAQSDGVFWHVSIADEGPGVLETHLDAIFDPFFRSTGAQKTEGFGLGLAIARRAIDIHGGAMRARNRMEGGLCVDIRLPRRLKAA